MILNSIETTKIPKPKPRPNPKTSMHHYILARRWMRLGTLSMLVTIVVTFLPMGWWHALGYLGIFGWGYCYGTERYHTALAQTYENSLME